MRAVKAGEECSIVTDSSDITIDQTTQASTTVVGIVDTDDISVSSTANFTKSGVATDGTKVFRYQSKTDTKFNLHCS